MKLISWNVNGIRAALNKGVDALLHSEDFDIIALQETKAQPDQIPSLGYDHYHCYVHSAVKKGYSGTMVLTKQAPVSVYYGLTTLNDDEGRVLTLEYPQFYLVNVYVPNSQNELKRLDYRQHWDACFLQYLQKLDQQKPLIVCGDMNVAHQTIDIKNPDTNHRNAGFTDEERYDFTKLLQGGFIDTFRHLYPDTIRYSWWSYRFKARERNVGWRIDYWLVSNRLMDQVIDSHIYDSWMGSDHAPVVLEVR